MTKKITRTFTGFNAKVLVMNNGNVVEKTTFVNATNEKEARKQIIKMFDSEVLITEMNKVEEVRAMGVETFYKFSEPFERPASQQK